MKQKKQSTLHGAHNFGVARMLQDQHGSSPQDAMHSKEKEGEDTDPNAMTSHHNNDTLDTTTHPMEIVGRG
eukprot:15085114-Ditylum_brightwellii.AAC.1